MDHTSVTSPDTDFPPNGRRGWQIVHSGCCKMSNLGLVTLIDDTAVTDVSCQGMAYFDPIQRILVRTCRLRVAMY